MVGCPIVMVLLFNQTSYTCADPMGIKTVHAPLFSEEKRFLPCDAMLARNMLSLSVCPSDCQSVTSRNYTKTAKHRITQTNTTRYSRDSSTVLTLKILAKFQRSHPLRGVPNRVGGGSNWQFSTNILQYLKNGAT